MSKDFRAAALPLTRDATLAAGCAQRREASVACQGDPARHECRGSEHLRTSLSFVYILAAVAGNCA